MEDHEMEGALAKYASFWFIPPGADERNGMVFHSLEDQ